ncbi:protein BTG2-like [Saccoglossus kowalevskii]|uniref:Protein BTG2-like n=1 Tax=Saccoglossus kowalevskii TaxID=10224 RepID=A0ABM0GVL9_SACKO|nr:PREDICTED: protein BTG2-like [Saccoglossus kowalevskii]
MKKEIRSAVNFLKNLLRTRNITDQRLDVFAKQLHDVLKLHYQQHWFPENPHKGSAYRCLRTCCNRMDPLIARAGELAGLSLTELHDLLPKELTIWIDPADVSYRIGEEGSICVLYECTNNSTKFSADLLRSCKDEVMGLNFTADHLHPRFAVAACL